MNNHASKCVASALLACAPLLAAANGMRLVSQDAFAASRGEAFTATADNPSAVYYNPAGLTQLKGTQVRAGINGLYFDPTFTPTNGGATDHIDNNLAAAPQLYVSHTWSKLPVSIGLGVYSPYGASVAWPDDTTFRTVAIQGDLLYIRANPVAAVEILPGLSLAAGLLVDYGEIDVEQGLRPSPNPFFYDVFQFTGDAWSVGYNAGLRWQITDRWAVGATFRSGTTLDFSGHTFIERQPTTRPTTIPASAEYEFPLTAVAGVSFRPTPRWNLELNVDYTDWSSLDVVTIRQSSPPPFPLQGQQNIPIEFQWDASWMIAVGVTHYFDDGWHVGGGYLFNQNSVPDTYYSPLVADLDRHFVAAGFGWGKGSVAFDLTYQFGYGPSRTVSGSIPPSIVPELAGQNADGTYEWISYAVLVSARLQF